VTGYLKRFFSALGAYQLATIVSSVMAVALLPFYTRRIPVGGYGIVETLVTFVVFASIVVRFGIIESFLRFYYTDEDVERRNALVRRAILFLAASSTIGCVILAIPAGALSHLITNHRIPGTYRFAVLGVWAFTNLELGQAVLRVDERLRAYATVALTNVLLTIVASVVLVFVLGRGYEGLIIGNYGASTIVLFGLWWALRGRIFVGARPPSLESWRTLLNFGLPTVPAEASVYALSVIDRQYIVHQHGINAAGRYAIAIKIAGALVLIVRAFQYAWPPLAYSVTDDAQASRLYGLVTTYYALITGFVVAGITLESHYIVNFLGRGPGYHGAYRAVPWVCLGWALYGLWVVLLVIAGRARVTRRNFPAAIVGLVANVALLLLLVPHFGIAGAGIAMCAAYVAMLTAMHFLIRDAFPVDFEWRRLAQLALVFAGMAVAGDLLLPTTGAAGLLLRAVVFAVMPLVLLVTGFAHHSELVRARHLAQVAWRRLRVAGA
jgi:O-antigen/teichoic acid export membrane protein